ncbi:hypothetical protein Tco_1388305 [Tanacetum coccineum]
MPAADSPTHQSPGYIPESDPKEDLEEDDEEDPEEDPADYPADRGDDRDDEESSDDDDDAEEEHLAPADPAAVAYSADQRKPCRNTLVPGYEVGRSSTAVASRQIHGITSMSHPGRLHRPHLEGSIKVIELTTTVDQEDEIIYSQLDDARRGPDLSRAAWATFERMLAINTFRGHTLWTTVIGSSVLDHVIAGSRPVKETDGDYRSAKSRPSETETVSGGTKDSEEPQDSDDRATETEGTC